MCGKYRGVRLLEHGMKLWEKILKKRLRDIVKIEDIHFGFQQDRSTTDAIFVMRQLQEGYKEKKKMLYLIFVDLEKAFDRVPREVIAWTLRRQMVPERLIKLVMALYVNSMSKVKRLAGISEEFSIRVGVHQGSALSPLLFIVVMQEAAKEARREGLKELLYADDLVLFAESEKEAVEKFRTWKREMERRGLRVNIEKTKVVKSGEELRIRMESGRYPCGCCGRGVGENSVWCAGCERWSHQRCSGVRDIRRVGVGFHCPTCVGGGRREEDVRQVRMGESPVEVVDSFCYLGDVI